MAHTINAKKAPKRHLVIHFFILLALAIFYIRYYNPVNIEKVCKNSAPLLVNNIHSCDAVEKVIGTLKSEGYIPLTLESDVAFGGLFREKFQREVFEVSGYKIRGDKNIGTARFKFINNKLSSIFFFPTAGSIIFELHPEKSSKDISVKHVTDLENKRYLIWSNNRLEEYVTWWIRRFS